MPSDSSDPDERMVRRLADERHDLVVVGGGIHGAFAAWQAARRGWRVALLERDDFGSGTSANSLKIAHGGLRYLQKLDVQRLRSSVRERSALRELAPALVRDLPCLLPVHGSGLRSRAALSLALAANELLSFGVRGSASARLPRGRTIDRAAYHSLAREFAVEGATGAALWYDALIESPERLLLSVVMAAEREGALVLNHAHVASVLSRDGRVTGVRVHRGAAGGRSVESIDVRASSVLLATGPWTGSLASGPQAQLVRGCNVVLRMDAARMPQVAVALPLPRENRMLFAVPWNSHLMVGTSYTALSAGDDSDEAVAGYSRDVESLVADIRRSVPALEITLDDVVHVHSGLLPGEAGRYGAVPLDRPVLAEGSTAGGPAGLVVLRGVKWTTARSVARDALELCARTSALKAGNNDRRRQDGATADSVLVPEADGAALAARVALLPGRAERDGDLASRVAARLARLRGARAGEILALAAAEAPLSRVVPETTILLAEIVHAIRREHARTLADLVMRRLELGTAGLPDATVVDAVAAVAADALGWNEEQTAAERARLYSNYSIAGTSG